MKIMLTGVRRTFSDVMLALTGVRRAFLDTSGHDVRVYRRNGFTYSLPMALDLEGIPPEARAEYIKVGQRYSSRDTLEQADQTLGALEKYGALLATAGFLSEDIEQLREARELLSQADVSRSGSQGIKRVASAAYVDAFEGARAARKKARVVLTGTKPVLKRASAKDAVAKIDVVLGQTTRASSSPKVMTRQLELLAEVLADASVMEAAANRNGPAATEQVLQAAAALRAEDRATALRRGTPAETQLMNLLDGIIVELTQHARQAAEVVSEELGNPALASAFKLDKLYRARKRRGGGETAEDEVDDADDSDTDNE